MLGLRDQSTLYLPEHGISMNRSTSQQLHQSIFGSLSLQPSSGEGQGPVVFHDLL